eukprot:TRINITY_DN5128_c0_g1_i1.p1 TRINITY_DN5128_c0_g1~~TRINITY_DN5128_c0_g1_i1.p1  ORF type:complete len:614 (-),score=186.52 TRINITY_DN5128_c0_g1_i1:64-1905(-)
MSSKSKRRNNKAGNNKDKELSSPKTAAPAAAVSPAAAAPAVAADAAEPSSVAATKALGDAAFKKKDFALAVVHYTQAINLEAKNDDKSDEKAQGPSELCKLYSNRCGAFYELRQFEDALRDADLIIALSPNWSKGYFRKGKALEGLVKFEEALEAHSKAFEIEPTEQYKRAVSDVPYNVMIQWLLGGGAKFPKLFLQYYDEDYRGVHVSQNIPVEEVIMEIPLKFIITTEIAKESEIGKKIIGSGVNLSSQHSYLACYLLQERHRGHSWWDPYLRCLPQKYANMPINFTDYEKEFLKGSFSLDKMAARVESLQNEYNNICDFVPEFKDIATYEQFVWARHVVITRIFGMVIQDDIKTNGLVPMADMLNHKRPRETKWTFDKAVNGFTITSLKQLHQGDEVFDSYGRKCNHRFFVNYGFSLDDNEDNEVVLKYLLSPEDPLFAIKAKYIGVENREFQIPANTEHEKTKEMFSFLRIYSTQEQDVKAFSQIKDFKLDNINPVSVNNEICMLREVQDAALRCLGGFDTTLEEDERILKEEKLTFNIRNAILMRRGEKQVCHFFVELANSIIPLFEMPVPKIREALKKLKKKMAKQNIENTLEKYVTGVVIPLVSKK